MEEISIFFKENEYKILQTKKWKREQMNARKRSTQNVASGIKINTNKMTEWIMLTQIKKSENYFLFSTFK